MTGWEARGVGSSIYALGSEATKEFALGFLREVGSGERLAIAMSTENPVSNDNLRTLAAVLENAALPLSPNSIDRIERSLS